MREWTHDKMEAFSHVICNLLTFYEYHEEAPSQ